MDSCHYRQTGRRFRKLALGKANMRCCVPGNGLDPDFVRASWGLMFAPNVARHFQAG
jgi:hypothetical protein